MIVGSGLLARAFAPRYAGDDRVLIFASGVSNSEETDPRQFQRESELLDQAIAADPRRLVYFSSCGVANAVEPLSPYMRHKLAMETRVSQRPGGLVIRLPQVVGRTGNAHTISHYLHDRILSGERINVWTRAERNLVDVDDVAAIADVMIGAEDSGPRVTTIAAEHSLPMPEIVGIFEAVMGRKANCVAVDRGSPLPIDAAPALAIASGLGIDLGEGYLRRVVEKYYAADRS